MMRPRSPFSQGRHQDRQRLAALNFASGYITLNLAVLG